MLNWIKRLFLWGKVAERHVAGESSTGSSNNLAFGLVFKTSVYFMAIGAVSALFVKEDKTKKAALIKKEQHHAIEI